MLYVDDVIAAGHNTPELMKDLGKCIQSKNSVIELPTNYLGAQLKKRDLPNGNYCWIYPAISISMQLLAT